MKLTIEIQCDNDAFDGVNFAYEIQNILGKTGTRIEYLHQVKPEIKIPPDSVTAPVEVTVLTDSNGNMVGTWALDYEMGS